MGVVKESNELFQEIARAVVRVTLLKQEQKLLAIVTEKVS